MRWYILNVINAFFMFSALLYIICYRFTQYAYYPITILVKFIHICH